MVTCNNAKLDTLENDTGFVPQTENLIIKAFFLSCSMLFQYPTKTRFRSLLQAFLRHSQIRAPTWGYCTSDLLIIVQSHDIFNFKAGFYYKCTVNYFCEIFSKCGYRLYYPYISVHRYKCKFYFNASQVMLIMHPPIY